MTANRPETSAHRPGLLGRSGIGAAALGRGGQAPADHPAEVPHLCRCRTSMVPTTVQHVTTRTTIPTIIKDRDGMICRMNEYPHSTARISINWRSPL